MSSSPIRTCNGCGEKFPQLELHRYRRRSDGEVVSTTVSHGRSAYLCANKSCFQRAEKKRALQRVWKNAGRVHADFGVLWAGSSDPARVSNNTKQGCVVKAELHSDHAVRPENNGRV